MKRILAFIFFITLVFMLHGDVQFAEFVTARHNFHRRNHGTPALKWNENIAKFAQEWAEKLAQQEIMYHRKQNEYGENIYWCSGYEFNPASAVDAWYDEIKYYNYSNPVISSATGHFTQVVWAGSTELGCGVAKSKRGGTYFVCNYNPPGNHVRRIDRNVYPLKKPGTEAEDISGYLPESIDVWSDDAFVLTQSVEGFSRRKLPIANYYKGIEKCVYIVVYSRKREGSVYGTWDGPFVMGLIRIKGTWKGKLAEPDGWEGKDFGKTEFFRKLALQYYPSCKNNECWVGGDTGDFFYRE